MKTATRQQQLLDQQLALSAYLDALLQATPAAGAAAAPVAAAPLSPAEATPRLRTGASQPPAVYPTGPSRASRPSCSRSLV